MVEFSVIQGDGERAMTPAHEAIWRMLETRWELGFEALASEEREAIALYWLEAEVMNGGLHQYFYNSAGDLAVLAVSALDRLGCERTLSILKGAMSKLGAETYPIDWSARQLLLGRLSEDFDAETRELQDLPERFFEAAMEDLSWRYGRKP